MKILAISGSPRKNSVTDQLVKAVAESAGKAKGVEYEFVSLAGMNIGPCVACLGCVKDNVCVVKDDMAGLRDKIAQADAYIIGGANYFSQLNGLCHCFMERWYQFRHREGKDLAGKLAVAVGVGGGDAEKPAELLQTYLQYNQVECVDTVKAQGPASCFTCGYGEDCKVGAIHMFFEPGTKITPEIIPSLQKQPEVMEQAARAGEKLAQRLTSLAEGF